MHWWCDGLQRLNIPKLLEQLKEVAIEGTIEDEIRPIFNQGV